MAQLTLEKANEIVAVALAKGRETECRPLTVVVLDAGGHVVALQRQDSSSILRPEIATGKAYGALGMGMPSRGLAKMAEERPAFIASLLTASAGRVVPVAGGVLIRDGDGAVLGAVGISGDTSEKDEACAIAGLEAAGFTTD